MTVIVGLEHNGRVYIGGDSALSGEGAITIMARPKVWQRGDVILGHAGGLRIGNIIEIEPDLPPCDGRDPYAFLLCEFLPPLMATVARHDLSWEAEELLVGVGGRLWCVDSEWGVHGHRRGYGATGDGAQAALGALHATDGQAPELRIQAALEASEAMCTSVCRPFHVVSC